MAFRDEGRLRAVNSRQNTLVKELRKRFLQAEPAEDGHIAVEGVRMIEEAIRSGLRFQAVFFSQSGQVHAPRLLPQLSSHVETLLLPDEVFSSAVRTETPQGVAALVKLKMIRLEDLLEDSNDNLLLVALAGVQDPGNVGTIIRSAEAFGAWAVLQGEHTASYANAKAMRASAGSAFRMPVLSGALTERIAMLKARGVRVIATSSHKGDPPEKATLTGPLTLVVGNEGAGLSQEIAAQADELVVIPHSPKVESLNAGIAASILLYEIARQRQGKSALP